MSAILSREMDSFLKKKTKEALTLIYNEAMRRIDNGEDVDIDYEKGVDVGNDGQWITRTPNGTYTYTIKINGGAVDR